MTQIPQVHRRHAARVGHLEVWPLAGSQTLQGQVPDPPHLPPMPQGRWEGRHAMLAGWKEAVMGFYQAPSWGEHSGTTVSAGLLQACPPSLHQ